MPVLNTPSIDDVRDPRRLTQHLGNLQRDLQQLTAVVAALQSAGAASAATASPDYAAIRNALEARGGFPLNVEQLQGKLAETQPSGLVTMTSATLPDPTRYVVGTLGSFASGTTTSIYQITLTASGVHVWTQLPIAPSNFWTTDSPQTIASGAAKTLNDVLTLAPSSGTAALTVTAGQIASSSQFGASVYRSAAQSITNNTPTSVTFDTEAFDRGGCHDTTVNTERITVPTGGAGLWLLLGSAVFDANAVGARSLWLRGNGGPLLSIMTVQACTVAATSTAIAVATISSAADADYFDLRVFQDSGGALNVISGFGQTSLIGYKLC